MLKHYRVSNNVEWNQAAKIKFFFYFEPELHSKHQQLGGKMDRHTCSPPFFCCFFVLFSFFVYVPPKEHLKLSPASAPIKASDVVLLFDQEQYNVQSKCQLYSVLMLNLKFSESSTSVQH